jgi:Mn2+/Fe2+ NRAMP family transporter
VRSVSRVEKGITKRQYSLSRWDVIVGCFVTDIVAFFIVVACGATLFLNGTHNIGDAMIWTTFVAPRKKPARPASLTVVTSLYACNPAITNPDFAPVPSRT